MHLVRFVIRIYHDARSPERQTQTLIFENGMKIITFQIFKNETHISKLQARENKGQVNYRQYPLSLGPESFAFHFNIQRHKVKHVQNL